MRTTSRIAVSAAVLGGGLLFATPASGQEVCAYPFNCPPTPGTPVSGNPGGPSTGNPGGPTVGNPDTPITGNPGGPSTGGGSTGSEGGAATDVDNSPVRNATGSGGGAASLPFTGGEVTLIALAGITAVGGGAALAAAGRRRGKA